VCVHIKKGMGMARVGAQRRRRRKYLPANEDLLGKMVMAPSAANS
jgi:hypothetical protein